jgi:hypothetical protein
MNGSVSGIMQVTAVIPASASGTAVPVVLQVGNATSQSGVTIAVATSTFSMTSEEVAGSLNTSAGGLICSAPVAQSSFGSTNPIVWVYFTYKGANQGDVLTANWIHPSGQLDPSQPSLTLNSNGGGCAAAPLVLAGSEAGQDPGAWQVKLYRNGSLQFTLPFSVTP